jgi:NAD(P)-dependent dehydrogenase (short-subunit alcohol dehydrogenase family)
MKKRPQAARQGRLLGKVAVVTGGSRGIGLAVAEALAAEGCAVALAGRNARALRAATRQVESHGVAVLARRCDVRDPKAVAALFTTVRRRFRRLDILFNNAGIAHPLRNVEKLPLKNWREVLETNLTGMFLCAKAAIPLMRRGGTIVNNLSISAKQVFPGNAAYDASKHGALGLTRTLREELRTRGIRVIALLPGATATDIWNQFWPGAPRSRMISPADVAAMVVEAVALPAGTTVEELVIAPTRGAL